MNRTMMYSIVGIALLASMGIGYAAFTSTITLNASSTAGNVNLLWSGSGWSTAAYTETGTSASWVNCGVSGGDTNSLTVTITALGPGDYCVITGYIVNTGNLPGSVTISNFATTGTSIGCSPGGVIANYCFLEDDTFHHQAVVGTGNGDSPNTNSELNGTAAIVSGLPSVGTSNLQVSIGANGAFIPFVMVIQLNDAVTNSAMGYGDTLVNTYTVTAS